MHQSKRNFRSREYSNRRIVAHGITNVAYCHPGNKGRIPAPGRIRLRHDRHQGVGLRPITIIPMKSQVIVIALIGIGIDRKEDFERSTPL